MEKFLDTYIGKMRGQYPGFPPETAHEIASAFIQFTFGLYENAVRECSHAIALIPDSQSNAALKKALTIVRVHAELRHNSQVASDLSVGFTEPERAYVAIDLPDDQIADRTTLELDNAIIFIYVVALITSLDDEEALLEHRRSIVRMLADYKTALGLH